MIGTDQELGKQWPALRLSLAEPRRPLHGTEQQVATGFILGGIAGDFS